MLIFWPNLIRDSFYDLNLLKKITLHLTEIICVKSCKQIERIFAIYRKFGENIMYKFCSSQHGTLKTFRLVLRVICMPIHSVS